mmetsp:Transcript_87156/g.251357  ORF Transcript_87156/g.251357 Transcript_87156/m.251357 type:complete len:103 (-) Transcript_87156:137-445(-)
MAAMSSFWEELVSCVCMSGKRSREPQHDQPRGGEPPRPVQAQAEAGGVVVYNVRPDGEPAPEPTPDVGAGPAGGRPMILVVSPPVNKKIAHPLLADQVAEEE